MSIPLRGDIDARLRAFGEVCRNDPLLRMLAEQPAPVHLVGGSVRDLLLGRPSHDHDFTTPTGAFDLARRVADAVGASFVPLKEAFGIARLTRQGEWFDVADYQAATLEADLRARDLTINAIAVDLAALVEGRPALIDPTGGVDDLARGLLRVPSPTVLDADPLRLLRIVRFACTLGYDVEASTAEALRGRAEALRRVAAERIRDELLKVLATSRAADGIGMLETCGALDVVLPELAPLRGLEQGAFHHCDVYEHTMLALRAVDDEALPALLEMHDTPGLRAMLGRRLGSGETTALAVLRLAALLHDVGKPRSRHVKPDGRVSYEGHERTGADMIEPIAARLRLSRAETALLRAVVRWHLEPLQMKSPSNLRPRHIRRYFARNEAGLETLVMALADSAASGGPKNTPKVKAELHERVKRMVGWWFSDAPAACVPLVDGREVAALTGLKPGPEIGRLLERLSDEQADGRVRTPDEARAWVARQAGRQTPS